MAPQSRCFSAPLQKIVKKRVKSHSNAEQELAHLNAAEEAFCAQECETMTARITISNKSKANEVKVDNLDKGVNVKPQGYQKHTPCTPDLNGTWKSLAHENTSSSSVLSR
ncbi:uncharacterized protein MELLADRAFT_112259 [Melampsora larici-populina 98AG31]|uniref:Uncharacterized protein n=1 Tax=Melampsora larici-populina (strain 98AG31 / pathotype 3-4-7) TaxID=747676 RepID=F4S5W5_MELLP|nr:uncharacterized protein MELLADRAFT_112259 [Melampsora larici-populina 98AG31]EGF99994.1 hypothetical protein MELLADRAFT_112259 [Melampsora larici-populina 98AG31]